MTRLNIKILTMLLLFVLTSSMAVFAQSSAQIVVQPYVVQGQNYTVTYRLVNCDDEVANAPQLKGSRLLYGPALSTYHSYEIINGRQTSTHITEYSFTYRADAAGKVTVPGIKINAGGKTIQVSAKSFEILPPDRQAAAHQTRPQAPGQPEPEPGEYRQKVNPNDLIVTVTLSKSNIYEKEAVIATIKVYTKHGISSFRATTLPSFEGFLSEELDVSNQQPIIEHYNGGNYYSVVLKQCVLYPQKSGRLTINSGRYDVTLLLDEVISYGYYQTTRSFKQDVTTSSRSISVDVKALPQPAPQGFNGAVGQFKATTSLEPAELRTNEAATYSVQISGTGNIKSMVAPTVNFPNGFEVYTPEVDAEARFNGKDMAGTFKVNYPLMPQATGSVTIPAWNFVYFDPSEAAYKTIQLPAYTRTVQRGTTAVDSQSDIAKMTDIEHITPMATVTLKRTPDFVFGTAIYVICYLFVIVVLVTAAIVYRRQIKLNADVVGRRTARAGRVANKRLRSARNAMQRHDNTKFYALLAQAMWGYISDKLRIPASALTRDNISERMAQYGANPQQIADTINILDECEMARFTPSHSDDSVTSMYDNAVAAINNIETIRPATKTPQHEND